MDLISTHICMTKDIGVHGNLFGGILMAWIDEAAASYACMYCDTPRMVTVKVNEMIFKKPVRQGHIVKIYAKVLKIGETSITLLLEVKRHDPLKGTEVLTTSTEIVFVKIDEEGHSTPLGDKIKEKFKVKQTLKS